MVKSKLSSWVGEACAGGVEHWVVGGHSAGESPEMRASHDYTGATRDDEVVTGPLD